MEAQDVNCVSEDDVNVKLENDKLKLQLAQFEKTQTDLQHRLEQRELKVLSLSQRSERLEIKLSMSKNDDERTIRELRAQNADLTSRNAHVEADMMNQLSELAGSLQDQIGVKERELENMKMSARESNDALQAENQNLNRAIELLKEKLSSMEKESVASLHRMRDRLVNDRTIMDARYEKDQKEILALRDENSTFTARQDKIKKHYEEEISATTAQYASTLQKVALKLKDKEEVIASSDEKIKSLESQLGSLREDRLILLQNNENGAQQHRNVNELHLSPQAQLMEPPSPVRSDYETMSVGSIPSSVMSDSVLSLPADLWKRAGEQQSKQRLTWRRTKSHKNNAELEKIQNELSFVTSHRNELQQKLLDHERQQVEIVENLERNLQERDTLIVDHNKEILSLKGRIDGYVESNTKMEEKVIDYQKKLRDIETMAREREEALNQLKSIEWEYTAARESHAESMTKLKTEISDASLRIKALKEKSVDDEITHKATLKAVSDKLDEKLVLITERDKSIVDMSKSLETVSSTIDIYKKSLNEANEKIKDQENIISSHKVAIRTFQANQTAGSSKSLEEQAKRHLIEQNELKTEVKDYQARTRDLELEVDCLHAKLQSSVSDKESDNDDDAVLRSDNTKLRESLDKALESLRLFSQGSSSSTTLELEYLEKIETLEEEMTSTKADLVMQLKDRDSRISQLRRSLSIKENKLTDILSRGKLFNGRMSPSLTSPKDLPRSGRSSPAFSELTEIDNGHSKKAAANDDAVNKLKEHVALLENKVSIMRSALHQFQASVDGKAVPAWELIEKLRQESELFAGQVIEQEQELEELTGQLTSQKALNQALSQDLEKVKKEMAAKKTSKIRSNDMIMMEQEEEIKQHLWDLKSERQKNLSLMKQLEDAREDLSKVKPALQKTIDDYITKNTTLEEEVRTLETRNKILKEQVIDHQGQISSLEDRLERISVKLEEFSYENLPKDVGELQTQLRQSEVARLEFEKTASANFERKIVLLRLDANVAMDKLRKKLKDSVAEKGKTEVALMNQVAQLEKDKNSLKKDLEGKIRTGENTIAQLESDLRNQDQLVKDLKAEQKQLRLSMSGVSEARKDEVEEINQDLIMANSRLAKQDRELKTLQMSIGDIKLKHKHELKVLLHRITELEGGNGEERADTYYEEQFSENDSARGNEGGGAHESDSDGNNDNSINQ